MLWQGFFCFFSAGFCKLYYFLSARLLDWVWLHTIDMLSLFIWIYSFCPIVFVGKKKVFTTFLACFENIDNITEHNYILHHSLMEIEGLLYNFWSCYFVKTLSKHYNLKNIYHLRSQYSSVLIIFRSIHFFYIKSEYWVTKWMNSFAKSVYHDDSDYTVTLVRVITTIERPLTFKGQSFIPFSHFSIVVIPWDPAPMRSP